MNVTIAWLVRQAEQHVDGHILVVELNDRERDLLKRMASCTGSTPENVVRCALYKHAQHLDLRVRARDFHVR